MYYFLGVFQAKMFVTNLLEPLQKHFSCTWPWICLGTQDWLSCVHGKEVRWLWSSVEPCSGYSPNPYFPVLLQVTRTFCQQGATVCRELPLLSWPLEGWLLPSPCWLPARPSQSSLSYPEPCGAGSEPWPPSRGCTDPALEVYIWLFLLSLIQHLVGTQLGIVCVFYII